jgi:hypothetical protein
MGSSYYAAANPPVGAVITYWVKDDVKTLKAKRQEEEKSKTDKKETVYYPDMEALRKEDEQPEPYMLFTIRDASGEVVRHLKTDASSGLKRIVWDFRYNTPAPVNGRYTPAPDQLFGGSEKGHLAIPGTYTVSLSKFEDGELTTIAGPVNLNAKSLNNATLAATDQNAYLEFCKKAAKLRKSVSAISQIHGDLSSQLEQYQQVMLDMPAAPQEALKKGYEIKKQLNLLSTQLYGDGTRARREFENPPSINDRVGLLLYGMWNTTSAPTKTYEESYRIAVKQFNPLLDALKAVSRDLDALGRQLEQSGAPSTPGRWPERM